MVIERFVDPLAQVSVTSTGRGDLVAESYGGIPLSGGMEASIRQAAGDALAGGMTSTQMMGMPGPQKVLQNQVSQLEAGMMSTLPVVAVPGAGAGVGMIPKIVGGAAGLYGMLQALGLGEGAGLFGTDLLGDVGGGGGGVPSASPRPPVDLGGPGLKEPGGQALLKEWHVKYDWGTLQYYLVRSGTGRRYIMLYNTRTGKWKWWAWRTPRLAVIGKNMPSHKMITRLRRNLSKHRADADTLLKLTSPSYQAYKSRKRRRRR